MCRVRQTLPKSYALPGVHLGAGGPPIVRGYYGDVHVGSLNGSKIRVKRLFTSLDGPGQKFTKVCHPHHRFPCSLTLEILQDFYEEAIAWKHLEHPNIVPLLGINMTPFPPQLISDWISGGNLTEYIKGNPGADRLGLVSVPLPSDGYRAHNLQAIWRRQRPRIPPFQRRGSREYEGGV